MMTLIVGGSGSGKSACAEDIMCGISDVNEKYYLATMQVYDEDGQKKVERHKRLRQGKGFLTIEQPTEVHQAVHKMKNKGQAVLLECMSNLTANEMFGEQMLSAEAAVCKIMDDIQTLQKNVRHLIIVSNNVFEDGVRYDESTMAYLSALGEINCRLSVMADRVIEVAAGLPIILKGSVTEDEAD